MILIQYDRCVAFLGGRMVELASFSEFFENFFQLFMCVVADAVE